MATMEMEVVTETQQDVLTTDNIASPEVLSKYRLAGHFCAVAIQSIIAQCVPGADCAQLCQLGDETILAQVHSGSAEGKH